MQSRCRALSFGLLSLALLACNQRPPEAKAPEEPTLASDQEAAWEQLADGEPDSALPIEADDARLGSRAPKVTVVGFLDFQCPYCAEGFQTLMVLREKYRNEPVRFVFKHLPLDSHQLALPAAIAGQAVMQLAGSEAFFDFATSAFQHQVAMDFSKLASWAEQAGVTRSAYNEAVGNEALLHRVVRDAVLAQSLGVASTPSFFVNGRMISGAQPASAFITEIDDELRAMQDVSEAQRAAVYAGRVTANTKISLARALLEEDSSDYRVPIDGSATWGPKDALVTVVAFSDYECPYCKRAEETLAELREKYSSDLRFVFKHHPLPFHQSALPSARLAEAVRTKSGDEAFFRVSGELFAKEGAPSLHELRTIGKAHGLTSDELEALAGNDPAIESRIRRDGYLADDVRASGTPHFFINGKRLAGARPRQHFEALIEAELERARQRIAEGVSRTEVYETLQGDAIQPGAPKRVELPKTRPGPVRGAPDASVTIHVFSDFQCPYCKRAETTLAELEQRFPGELAFVWHNLPLPFHDRARPAARAALEALRQKGTRGFWQMHDALFGPEGQPAALSTEDILGYGKTLGLDRNLLEKALDEDPASGALKADEELAAALGIRGTPAFVVGDYLITGARELPHFERVVRLSLDGPKADPSASAEVSSSSQRTSHTRYEAKDSVR